MALSVRHRPLGDEHPYAISSDQLEPPHPIAGEPIVIHAVTPSAERAERVWVRLTSPDRPEPMEFDCLVAGGATREKTGPGGGVIRTEETEWRAEIGVRGAGTFTYSVLASSGDATVSTGPFTCTVREVVRLSAINGLGRDHRSLLITYAPAGEPGTVYGQLIEFDDDGSIVLRVGEAGAFAGHVHGESTSDVNPGETVVIAQYRVDVSQADGTLLITDIAGNELLRESAPIAIVSHEPGEILDVTRTFHSPEDEAFYGLGERYHAFNQRGCRVDTRVFEQYRRQGQRSYIPVPILISSRGYGLWTQTLRRCRYDLAATDPRTVTMTGSDPIVTARLIPGAPREVVRAFAARVGRPAVPPSWAFGPWMSSNEWNSEARLMKEVETTEREDIPASVVVVEAWSDEQTFYIWNDTDVRTIAADEPLRYSDLILNPAGKWPDPRSMIRRLHERDIRILLWQIPVVKPLGAEHRLHALDEAYVVDHGLGVKDSDGGPHHSRPGWFTGSLIPDFTNRETRRWWFNKRRYLLDECSVDGFKTDGGEQLWGEATRFSDGRRGDEMINAYPLEYLDAYHEAMKQSGLPPLTFSRSGYTGVQRYPIHWAGDQESTWEEFRSVYRAVLNAGLSGIAILGWDIAGFAGDLPTAELYMRSVTCATFSAIMQYHSEYNDHRVPSNDRSPWNVAELTGEPKVLSTFRRYAHLRMRLIPYLSAEAEHAARSGDPLVAPVFYHADNDPEAWPVSDQHWLGRALLVAPILEEGRATREVYLPAGEWQDVWSGETVAGPARLHVNAGLSEIPVYLNLRAAWPLDGLEPFQGLPAGE